MEAIPRAAVASHQNGAPHELGAARCRPLSPQAARALVDSVDAFLFDCDGVIWKGDKLIDGAREAVQTLRSMVLKDLFKIDSLLENFRGKKLVFVTNNSTKSRKQYVKKFQGLGLSVTEEEIFSSAFAAAMFLKLKKFPQDKKVYAIGHDGILDEMALAGITCLGGPKDADKRTSLKSDFKFEHDENVGAVVVGLDLDINYYKIQYATQCIRDNPGCHFIATNCDAVGFITDSQKRPAAGSMVGAICGSTQKEPILVGKPSTFMMDFLLERFQIPTSRMCMVGDRLDTDILFGQSAGCRTLLVLTGVTTIPVLQDPANNIHPDFYANNVADIVDHLGI